MQQTAKRIAYIDGPRLQQALVAGIHRVISQRDYINKINVFPVPDGDTGTNVAFTLSSVLQATEVPSAGAGDLLDRVADAALDGARGNSGAILAQFLQGLSDAIGQRTRIDAESLVNAAMDAARCAREAIEEPREGTLLSVFTDYAAGLKALYDQGTHDIQALLEQGLTIARKSLAATPSQLAVLRQAGVVDAGGQAFVELLEGIDHLIRQGPQEVPPDLQQALDDAAPMDDTMHGGDHRYCTECMVVGEAIDRRKLREAIGELDHSSLVLAGTRDRVRVHVHVNDPARLHETCGQFGEVSQHKADDMHRQESAASSHQPVAILTDSGADLPDRDLERLNIHLMPVRVHFGERSYLDKVTLTPHEFYRKLRTEGIHPKTSQPPPGDFRRQFEHLASHHENVLSINVSGKVSGTRQAALAAAERVDAERVVVYDSFNAGPGQGLLAMAAAELATRGANVDKIVERLDTLRPQTSTYVLIDDLSYGVRGGRVKPIHQRVADWLHLTPVIGNDQQGYIKARGVLFGRKNLNPRFARFLGKRMDPSRQWRVLIGHCDCRDSANQLEQLIDQQPQVRSTRTIAAGTAFGVHAGPGALCVAIQPYMPPE